MAGSLRGTHAIHGSAAVAIAQSVGAPATDITHVAAVRASSGGPLAIPTQARPRPAARAQPGVAGAVLAVREFAPGSKAYSQAIAAHIASEATQDVVSPLARLYLASFGRVPDYEGFDHYIGERDRGEPLDAIAEEFAGSEEFQARYGALDNAAFVDRVLENILGFPGDAQRRAYWIDQIESGRMTRGQVMLAFSESPGYRALTANEVFVAIAYAQTLGRAPDAADLARWVSFLDAGNSRRAVVESLLASRPRPPAQPTPRRD